MHILVRRNIDDIVAFSDHYLSRSRVVKRVTARYRLFGSLILGGVTFLAIYITAPSLPLLATVGALATALSFAFRARGLVRRGQIRTIHRIYTEGPNPAALKDVEIEVMDTGILARTDTVETRIAWSAIQDIVSTQTHTFLHLSPLRAIIIPHQKVVEGNLPALLAEIGRRYHPTHTLPPGSL